MNRLLRGFAALIFIVLLVDVLWGVFSRQVLNNQSAWTEELARYLLVWLAMIGGVLAYVDNRHLGVDTLVSSLDDGARRTARKACHLTVLGFSVGVLLIGGGELVVDRWSSGQMSAALGIRKAWFYMILPLSGAMISSLAFARLLSSFRRVRGKEDSL